MKLVVDEDGSELAAAIWDGCDAALSSLLACPEVRAALAAAGRVGRLGREGQRRAEAAWEDFGAATRAVTLTEQVARRAGDLTSRLSLRGADAVHQASALTLGTEDLVVAVWDARLAAGARATGLRVVAPHGR